MLRVCKKCGEEKPLESFKEHKQCKHGREYTCTACTTNRLSDRRRAKKRRAIEYLGGACNHCGGVFHPAVYDFHHIDPTEKEADPGSLMGRKWERIKQELDKCLLLCANCHRMEHANESN
jgi:predicted HNH restriction endonuclease